MKCHKYIIVGAEVGDQGTPHLQGYVYFKTAKTISAAKKYIGKRAHIEICRGTPEQNIQYCSKESNIVIESGTKPQSSKEKGENEKQRWKRARESAQKGELEDIPDDIYIKYYRTLKLIKKDHMKNVHDADDVTGVWLYGQAGVGKSRKAREDYPEAYLKMCNKWWDGYQDEDYVIMDDIDPNHSCLGHHLKIWSDRYAFLAETKGGAIKIRPKKIIITSQFHPSSIWQDSETLQAIDRRFEIEEIKR